MAISIIAKITSVHFFILHISFFGYGFRSSNSLKAVIWYWLFVAILPWIMARDTQLAATPFVNAVFDARDKISKEPFH
jgi:hypothetical protein